MEHGVGGLGVGTEWGAGGYRSRLERGAAFSPLTYSAD